jgi:hypothetical protein
MNRTAKITLQVIGAVAILCAAFGLYYNASSLAVAFSGAFTAGESRHKTPYFYQAFYVMSAICIACYVLLFVYGVQFIRGHVAHAGRFTTLLVFEIVYFFSIAMFWLAPGVGRSIGAATGVANGGLMAQFLILFPLWAPLLVFWARRHLHKATNVA